jgi:hypothetical protein
MKEYVRKEIQSRASAIREKLGTASLLYGERFDLQDPDSLIVAAYLLGSIEGIINTEPSNVLERVLL